MEKTFNRNLATVPEQLFAELTAEVADLAEIFARTILNVEINSVVAHLAEVNRTAEVLRVSSGRCNEQSELKATSDVTACDSQALEMAEAVMFPLSPQPDYTDNASRGETNLVVELTSKLEAAFPDASYQEKNSVAARVAELQERLDGFLTPSLPQPADQNT